MGFSRHRNDLHTNSLRVLCVLMFKKTFLLMSVLWGVVGVASSRKWVEGWRMQNCTMLTRTGPGAVWILAVAGWMMLSAAVVQADDLAKLDRQSAEALTRFHQADSTLAEAMASAKGYAIFPRIGKGGFGIGAAHGEGLVYENGQRVGKAKLTQITVGLQIGGQVFLELILFETAEALEHFKGSNFALSAQAGAVAAAEGVAKNARYRDGVLVMTQVHQGVMAEASVGGQKFSYTALP